MPVTEGSSRTTHNRRFLLGVVGVWLLLVACCYLMYPLIDAISLLALLALAACWLSAGSGSVLALIVLLRRRAYGWAAGVLVVALGSGLLLWTTDWERTYVDSQFHLHRNQLAELAARYRNGQLPSASVLPWRLRHLSIDGRAHKRDSALYLPVWQDWRAESGVGIGYFPTSPGTDTLIATAAGDMGQPVRYLGDGWWWVA
ncbi:hypothetical protein [Micromonospora echinofusca]|uniref:DUF4190 domain-containing protein n=1 Tax=Micromonospora echinofusca TaxID=47858 RepID=A0ABS3VNQ0_MICEH|nr:hypothetical protein [Micromonospora echinofusca]MBO4206144.1 hypothetical protein [Micromonospora echinofusca]